QITNLYGLVLSLHLAPRGDQYARHAAVVVEENFDRRLAGRRSLQLHVPLFDDAAVAIDPGPVHVGGNAVALIEDHPDHFPYVPAGVGALSQSLAIDTRIEH